MSQIVFELICSIKCFFLNVLSSGQKSWCPWNAPYPRKTPIIIYRNTASSWDLATIRTIPHRNREAYWLLKANRKPERNSVRAPWLIGRWFIYLYLFFLHAYARAGRRCISKDLFHTSVSSVRIYLSASHSTDTSSGIGSRKMHASKFCYGAVNFIKTANTFTRNIYSQLH